ncbi:hypothetical protein E2562_005915 [Oryza meyeriana var. granulata]|uniref:Transposase MuDR plant domain-containing protein n=1 Tax=Oryza meyeriana var. granulata TaxID=110450 RepID=A0A6G1DVU0_9ORYZ|nr:hypothetical protein E2562_005915 [Oryza meyeriana var. granulata]
MRRGKVAASNVCGMVEEGVDNDAAAIPISDAIPNELVISYDKDHPVMDLGTIYPSMDEFRMAVRQFAINEEFALGTEKSDKKRFRGFCKSSDDCPWKINASKHKGQSTVEVTALTDHHTCVFTMRVKTITPYQKWVASKARGIDLEQFVYEYYSVDRFKAAYGREIEPMTDKSQWPQVELPFVVGAPLTKGKGGRRRKLRIKGCLEGGHKKKGANKGSNEGGNDGEGANNGTNGGGNDAAPTNAKGKKMIRGPMTCKR